MALDQTQDQPRSAAETGAQMPPGAPSLDDAEKYFLSIEKAIGMNRSPEQAADEVVGEIDHEADEELAKDSALAKGIEDTEIEIQVSASQKAAEAEIGKRSVQAKAEIASALAPTAEAAPVEAAIVPRPVEAPAMAVAPAESIETVRESVKVREGRIEENLRKMQGIFTEIAMRPDLTKEMLAEKLRQVEGLQGSNVEDWDAVNAATAAHGSEGVYSNEALADIQRNMSDSIQDLGQALGSGGTAESIGAATKQVFTRLGENMAHFDMVNRSDPKHGPEVRQPLGESGEYLNTFLVAMENDIDPEVLERDREDFQRQNAMYDSFLKSINENNKTLTDEQKAGYAGVIAYMEGARDQNTLTMRLEDMRATGAPAEQIAEAEKQLLAQAGEVKKILAANPGIDPEKMIQYGMPTHSMLVEGAQRRSDAEAGMTPDQQAANSIRRDIGGIMKDMARAKLVGSMERYAMLLSVLATAKEQLMGQLGTRADAGPEELAEKSRLGVEVGLLKNEADERAEAAGIADKESEVKKLDVRIAELERSGGDAMEVASLKSNRTALEGDIKARRGRVADLQGSKGKMNNLLSSYGGATTYDSGPAGGGGGPKKDTHLGHAWEKGVQQIGKGMLDPWSVVHAALDKVSGPAKKE